MLVFTPTMIPAKKSDFLLKSTLYFCPEMWHPRSKRLLDRRGNRSAGGSHNPQIRAEKCYCRSYPSFENRFLSRQREGISGGRRVADRAYQAALRAVAHPALPGFDRAFIDWGREASRALLSNQKRKHNMSKESKLGRLRRTAEKQGWRIVRGKGSHEKWFPPNPQRQMVVVRVFDDRSSSRDWQNTLKFLRRGGLRGV